MFGFIIKSWCRKDMTDFNISYQKGRNELITWADHQMTVILVGNVPGCERCAASKFNE